MNWGKTPARILAHDRRKSAVHEAGHYVIGRHFGLKSGDAWISPTGADPRGDEQTWIGQHRVRREELDRLSDIRRMMLGVSGLVAERRWEEAVNDPSDWPTDLYEALEEPEIMSWSDWKMALHEPGHPTRKLIRAAERVEALLAGPLWLDLCLAARSLIRFHGIALDKNGRPAWREELREIHRAANLTP